MLAAKCEPDVISYSASVSACDRGEQGQRAPVLISETCEAKLEPNATNYSAGVSACEKGGQWQRTLVLLSEMWKARLEPSVIYPTMPEAARN